MVEAAAEAAVAASVQPSMTELSLDVPLDEPLEGDPTEGFDLGAEEPTVPASAHDGFELGGSLDLDISMTGGASPFTSGSLADFSQQESPSASGGLELDAGDEDVPLELAAAHEFLGGPPAESVRAPLPLTLRAAPLAPAIAARPLTPLPLTPAIAPRPTTPSPLAAPLPSARVEALKSTAPDLGPRAPSAGDAQGEAALRLALSQASREVIERIVWEVVPQLAEVMLREHIERLAQDRAGK